MINVTVGNKNTGYQIGEYLMEEKSSWFQTDITAHNSSMLECILLQIVVYWNKMRGTKRPLL